jgi:hypothetical protein
MHVSLGGSAVRYEMLFISALTMGDGGTGRNARPEQNARRGQKRLKVSPNETPYLPILGTLARVE